MWEITVVSHSISWENERKKNKVPERRCPLLTCFPEPSVPDSVLYFISVLRICLLFFLNKIYCLQYLISTIMLHFTPVSWIVQTVILFTKKCCISLSQIIDVFFFPLKYSVLLVHEALAAAAWATNTGRVLSSRGSSRKSHSGSVTALRERETLARATETRHTANKQEEHLETELRAKMSQQPGHKEPFRISLQKAPELCPAADAQPQVRVEPLRGMGSLLSQELLHSLSWGTEPVLVAHANYENIHASLTSFNELYFNPVQLLQKFKSNALHLTITCRKQALLQVIVVEVFPSCC